MDARPTGLAAKDDAYDVSDPTDWLNTPLASLMQVEQSLRCHVCKDFYNSPMITSCCHTFCSLCIRKALATDGKCPECRATAQESTLRGNWAIRDAVEHFTNSRAVMLSLAYNQPYTGAEATKRKAYTESADDDHGSKRTRMSTRLSSMKAARATATIMKEEVNIPEVKETEEFVPDDGLVPCPICQWRMKPARVDKHLDTDCPGEIIPQPKIPRSKQVAITTARQMKADAPEAPERLPSTNYSILKEGALKKKLSDLRIPAWGNKQQLEKRHREWVIIWNANCDSARPRSKQDLLRDLDIWERTQGAQAPSISSSTSLGSQIKDKDFNGEGWATKHNNTFKDLIADARQSQKKINHKQSSSSTQYAEEPLQPYANGANHKDSTQAMINSVAGSDEVRSRSIATIDLTSPLSSQSCVDSFPTRGSVRETTDLLSNDGNSSTEVDMLVSSGFAGSPK